MTVSEVDPVATEVALAAWALARGVSRIEAIALAKRTVREFQHENRRVTTLELIHHLDRLIGALHD